MAHYTISPRQRNTLLLRLAALLKNEMSLAGCLDRMAAEAPKLVKVCAMGLRDRVAAGSTLADAMDADPRNFPRATVALVRSGAYSGDLWKAVRDAAEFEALISMPRQLQFPSVLRNTIRSILRIGCVA